MHICMYFCEYEYICENTHVHILSTIKYLDAILKEKSNFSGMHSD